VGWLSRQPAESWWSVPSALTAQVVHQIVTSESGYSNDQVSLEWLRHFEEFTAPKQQGHKRLLIVDGHGSHHTLKFVGFCDSHDIIPFGMPPHLPHLLQPLDVAVFQPLKHYQVKALDTIIRDGCAHITKLEFLAYIQQIRTQAFKESTVESAFKKTGIHSFNPQVVLQEIVDRMPQHTPSPSFGIHPLQIHMARP
jgi:hypothetical protein